MEPQNVISIPNDVQYTKVPTYAEGYRQGFDDARSVHLNTATLQTADVAPVAPSKSGTEALYMTYIRWAVTLIAVIATAYFTRTQPTTLPAFPGVQYVPMQVVPAGK